MIRKTLIALAVSLLTVAGLAAPARASLPVVCANGSICFVEGGLSFQAYSVNIPRNTCRGVSDNRTEAVDNETGADWLVWTSTNCTGTAGRIFAHTNGPMAGQWYRSIGSTERLAVN